MNNHTHLSEEEIYSLLEQAGDDPEASDSAASLHLAACSACRSEVASLRNSLSIFRQTTTNAALAQAPLTPPRRMGTEIAHTGFRRYAWSASLATAAVLLAMAVSVFRPEAQPPVAPVPAATVQVATGESDEALLEGIQRDLSTSIPPSLEPLAVPAAANATPASN